MQPHSRPVWQEVMGTASVTSRAKQRPMSGEESCLRDVKLAAPACKHLQFPTWLSSCPNCTFCSKTWQVFGAVRGSALFVRHAETVYGLRTALHAGGGNTSSQSVFARLSLMDLKPAHANPFRACQHVICQINASGFGAIKLSVFERDL